MEKLGVGKETISEILTLKDNYKETYLKNEGHFYDTIVLSNLEIFATDHDIVLGPGFIVEHDVHFEDVHFKCAFSFGDIVFKKNLSFLRCTFEERFSIGITIFKIKDNKQYNGYTVFKDLYFTDCIFMNKFSIYNGKFENIQADNCKFSSKPVLIDPQKDDIYIQGGYFKKGFALLGGEVDNNVNINGGHFKYALFFGKGINVKSKILVVNGYMESIEIHNATINEFFIYNSYRRYLPKIVIDKSIKRFQIMTMKPENSLLIKDLTFNHSPEIVSIKGNCMIGNCSFLDYDSNSNSTISFNGVIIGNIKFINFNNYGKINFINLMPRKNNSTITSEYSNLGNIDFISCDLSKYNFIVDNSKLINLFYTSTKFPKNLVSKKEGIENVRQLRDTYDQLQTVASKQGDRITSLRWQQSSLKYYFKSLKPLKRKWWILLFMLLSNNFRMSSLYGLLFTLISGIVLYYFYYLFYTGILNNNCSSIEEIKFEDYFQYYFEFINPTHRSDFIGKVSKNPIMTGFIDLLGRIIVGFGIYQTIQAFRRYGKGD